MPIHQEHVEDHIIAGIWDGIVTMEEVFQSVDESHAIAQEKGYDSYVQILDARTLRNMPFEVRALSKVTRLNIKAMCYLIVGAPVWVKALTRILGTISRTPMEHFDEYDDAVARGREILAEKTL